MNVAVIDRPGETVGLDVTVPAADVRRMTSAQFRRLGVRSVVYLRSGLLNGETAFVIHAADGMFPSDLATGSRDEIEEERRLFYVAITRAKEHLYIYAPLRYHHSGPFGRGDAHSYAQRTRFLPPAANELLEHRPVRARAVDSVSVPVTVDLTSSVEEGLRGLW